MALFLSFSCFLRPLPVFASFLALSSDGTFSTLLPVSSFCGGSFAGFARRLHSARLASTRAVVCVGLLAQKSLAETFRANVPPLDSAKNDAKTGNGRQKHEKNRNKAMLISLSYTSFTLNNSHFSLLKKGRDKLAPGARFARSGGPLAASFFLQKREMRVVECKRSVAKGYKHGFVPVFFVLLASVAGLCVVFGAVKWRDVRTLCRGGSFAGFARRLRSARLAPSFAFGLRRAEVHCRNISWPHVYRRIISAHMFAWLEQRLLVCVSAETSFSVFVFLNN